MKVLFVCDGNICRSPLAAEYLRVRAAGAGLAHLIVGSVGLLGIEGRPAAPLSIQIAREAGLDLTSHRSRGISAAEVGTTDLLVGMTIEHLDALAARYPRDPGRRFVLRAFERGPIPEAGAPNLDDPVLGPIASYRAAWDVIRPSVEHMVLWLKHAA